MMSGEYRSGLADTEVDPGGNTEGEIFIDKGGEEGACPNLSDCYRNYIYKK